MTAIRRRLRAAPQLGRLLPLLLAALLATAAGAADGPEVPEAALDVLPHRSRLGLRVQPLTPELREHFGAPEDRGLLVSQVEAGRAAADAGLEAGDVLVAAGGEPLHDTFDLVRSVARVPAGGTLALELLREEEARTLEVAPEGESMAWVDPESWRRWAEKGLREGSHELRRRLDQLEQHLRELERDLEEREDGSDEGGRPI